jgi:hypothetical protein
MSERPCCRFSRRARARIVDNESAGVSSKERKNEEEPFLHTVVRNLYRSRHLIASMLDEIVKANEHLRSLRIAAWLIVWLLIGAAALRLWRQW